MTAFHVRMLRLPAIVAAALVAMLGVGLEVALAAPPPNDNLASFASVSSLPFSASLSTLEATLQASEPSPVCEVGATDIGNTVWYRYTPATSVTVLADTTGSNFDTVVAAYSGPAASPTFGSLSSVGCDDDSGGAGTSAFMFAATGGTTYYVQVGGSAAESGSLVFNLAAPSANDNLANAASALPLPYSGATLTTAATLEAGEPSPACEYGATSIGKTVWYKFTPSSAMTLSADTNGSNFDTVLAVYSGPAVSPSFPALSFVECDDQSGWLDGSALAFVATAGLTYYFQAGGMFGDSDNLTFNLAIALDADTDGVPDANDNCPLWTNAGQTLPPWPVPANDGDCDGFTDAREQHVGTDPAKHCNNTVTANDEADAWPSDFNDSRTTNLSDVILMGASYNKSDGQPGYNQRFDLNGDSAVNLPDVIILGPYYNRSCE